MKMRRIAATLGTIAVAAVLSCGASFPAQASSVSVFISDYTQVELEEHMTLIIGEKEYQLPFDFSMLLDEGWICPYPDMVLKPGERSEMILTNTEGNELWIYVKNMGEAEESVLNCSVGGVNDWTEVIQEGSTCDFELKNDVKTNMTLSQVLEILGGTAEMEGDDENYSISLSGEDYHLMGEGFMQLVVNFGKEDDDDCAASLCFQFIEQKLEAISATVIGF